MEINLIVLILLFVSTDATTTKGHLFTKLLCVTPQDHSMYPLSSNPGISNRVECAVYCLIEECVSFSYTEVDKRCDTYANEIVGDGLVHVCNSTVYFSKDMTTNISSAVSDVQPETSTDTTTSISSAVADVQPESSTDTTTSISSAVADVQPESPSDTLMSICSEVQDSESPSGVYRVSQEDTSFSVFCDVDSPNGPWNVIQRRINGDVDFNRSWTEYKEGFGDLHDGDFWIGNDILHILTNTSKTLRIELEAWNGTKAYAQYSTFQVANEDQNYTLHLQGFSGNVSNDAMDNYDVTPFTTYDRYNDMYSQDCPFRGAWWYRSCTKLNLNGGYYPDIGEDNPKAIFWRNFFPGRLYAPLKKTVMMIQ